MTAAKSWPNFRSKRWEAKVDSQVAAPAETRTPNWHRANHRSQKSADGRMAAEADRFEEDHSTSKGNYKTDLTLTGLLMEGLGMRQLAQKQVRRSQT